MKEHKVFNVVGFILIVIGVVFFLYPKVINGYNKMGSNSQIKTFESEVKNDEKSLIEKLKLDCFTYNQKIYEDGQKVQDPFFYEGESIDLSQYGLKNNMFGYIEVPKINVKLGIYLGASKENMNKGAVHLNNTSLPTGEKNSNCVIAAHRGNGRFGDMFRNIDKLEIGDKVYVTNPWEKLEYEVSEVFYISPEDINKILIQDNKDMITLVSCHPYGSSKYRYIVYCERVGE